MISSAIKTIPIYIAKEHKVAAKTQQLTKPLRPAELNRPCNPVD